MEKAQFRSLFTGDIVKIKGEIEYPITFSAVSYDPDALWPQILFFDIKSKKRYSYHVKDFDRLNQQLYYVRCLLTEKVYNKEKW